jgi:hypothetical protein
VCARARSLLKNIQNSETTAVQTIEMVKEMNELDRVSTTWRDGPAWEFKTIHRTQISDDIGAVSRFPEYIQLHQDVWIAYEWNYHRTARIILHEHLLECLSRLEGMCPKESGVLGDITSSRETSISLIQSLVDEILSTVPQSLGEIDHEGKSLEITKGLSICQGVGGYFLLWPIKIVKGLPCATSEQRTSAQRVFERIRDCTGMKEMLGDASSI